MKYIDIHSHVQFAAFDEDRDDVVKRTMDATVGMINVGTQADTSQNAIDLANKYPDQNIWAMVGLHPVHTGKSFHDKKELGADHEEKGFTSRGEVFDYELYKKMALSNKVVGIGEIGLDYYHLNNRSNDPPSSEDSGVAMQKKVFEQQIALANEVKKPLMLHVRNQKGAGGGQAYDDVLDILKSTHYSPFTIHPGNLHCFTGDWETGKKFLDLGFTLSFTGMITFTHDYDEVVKKTPLDMIMTETDCPYITPVPHRGERNEPRYVEYVTKKIAEIKGLSENEVAQQMITNAKRVFNI